MKMLQVELKRSEFWRRCILIKCMIMVVDIVTTSALQSSKVEGELPWADMATAIDAIRAGTKGLRSKALAAMPLYFWIEEEAGSAD